MDPITFTVAGMAPAPQGSKRHLGNGVMVESSKNVKPWRYLVQQAAIATGAEMITVGVSMSTVFLFNRPKGHYRKDGSLTANAPRWHTVRPDGSKLLRSTEDAIVDAGLLRDDSLICCSTFTKRYCAGKEKPGAIITLIPLP
jgi:crossover junction endodeoxyribonuclease RusA